MSTVKANKYAIMPFEDYEEACNAIREKTGTSELIKSGSLGTMTGSIEAKPVLQDKTVTPTTSKQTVAADSDYDGLDIVTVNAIPSSYIVPSGIRDITENGTYDVKNYSSAQVNVAGSGGSTDVEDALITRSMSTYTNSRVSTIGQGAFAYANNLQTVNFPACSYIGDDAFIHCSSLTTVSFPVCTSIGENAFEYCSSLTSVNFPACTRMDNNAFRCCTSLTSVNFPACKNVGNGAFEYCSSLTSVNFPACTHISAYAFHDCVSLTSVNFPACTHISVYAFEYCKSLTTVSLPACRSISDNAFYDCHNLVSLYLTGSSLCTLYDSNAFTLTPIAGFSTYIINSGAIYVPQSLLTSYKTATNWTYFSSKFYAVENGDVDTNIALSDAVINFNMDDHEEMQIWHAEKGMTWAEWCDSEYNTHGVYVYENGGTQYVGSVSESFFGTEYEIIRLENVTPVSPTDVIIAEGNYSYFT